MDFKERLDLYQEGGMISSKDVEDINAVVAMFKDIYQIELAEENAGTFIAHLCAAYGRNRTKEEVQPLGDDITRELKSLETYELSKEVLENILKVTQNPMSEVEKDYALLHINNLIACLKDSR